MKSRAVLPAVLGNILEYYDFTLFAVFSGPIGAVFFPQMDSFLSTLLTLSVFSVGFFMRPLGAVFFGQMGDQKGRKTALTTSILLMAVPTLGIGLLPGYSTLGVYAPIFLVFLRLIQGLSIGGEGAGAAVFLFEHHGKGREGLLGGVLTASNFIGALGATVVADVVHWRGAFIFGGLLGVVAFYLRLRAFETPDFQMMKQAEKTLSFPLFQALKRYKKSMVITLCAGGLAGGFAFLILGYLRIFFHHTLGFSDSAAGFFSVCGVASFIVLLPLLGWWADKKGCVVMIKWGCLLTFFLIYPLFLLFRSGGLWGNILPIVLLSTLGAWVCAPAYPVVWRLFPAECRYSAVAVSFNLGLAIFGGTAPLILAFLVQRTGLHTAPALYLMALSVLFLVCSRGLTIKKE